MEFSTKLGSNLAGFTDEVGKRDMMKIRETFGVGETSAERCTRTNAAGVVGYAAGTGLNESVFKKKSSFSKMTAMESGSSGSERFAATRAHSQLGSYAIPPGDWKGELAPTYDEVKSGQNRGCVEHRKGLAKESDKQMVAQ
jgi:hypothetical protein